MIYVYWVLAVLFLFAVFLIGVGVYEFFVEDYQERKTHAKMDLHLKHFDKINSGH